MGNDLPGVECHQQAFAGTLGVPDDADATVALGTRSGDRAIDRMAYGMELMISCDDLDQSGTCIGKHGEVPDQGQETLSLEHPPDDRLKLRFTLRSDGGPVHGAPGHEPF